MRKLTAITPYDDDKLIWNETTNQYELAFQFCKDEFDDNFRDDEILKKRIKKNTRIIYRFITNRMNSYNRLLGLRIINRTEEGRNFIFEMLRTQFESDVDSGYNDLTNAPAVNLANGQVLPREEILRNEVSVATEQVWDSNQAYFGINLGYQAQFPPYYQLMLRNL